MKKSKGPIIALFCSIFLIKVVLCLATVYFHCNNEKLMNSLIMQLEIEHEDHSNDNLKELFAKESKFTHKEFSSHKLGATETNAEVYFGFTDLYPINALYTEIVTPPPEQLS